jgi:hypothetical protein
VNLMSENPTSQANRHRDASTARLLFCVGVGWAVTAALFSPVAIHADPNSRCAGYAYNPSGSSSCVFGYGQGRTRGNVGPCGQLLQMAQGGQYTPNPLDNQAFLWGCQGAKQDFGIPLP